jgi:predicted deacylase
MIKSYTYFAEESGPRVLILGAVHGNEVCGTLAIQRVMTELDEGKLTLLCGHVEFVPVANPRAYKAGQRFIERNLNRYFRPAPEPKPYEAKLTNILCKMIEVCDYFIDLHSTTAGGLPFASVEGGEPEEDKLAAAMGAEVLLFGWHEAYAASGRVNTDPDESMGTTAYARKYGAKAVLLECGQHKDPVSIEVAYKAILGALHYIGMINSDNVPAPSNPLALKTTRVIFRGEGGSFTEDWGNFSPITAGQQVAVLPDGGMVLAPSDGFIVLPNPTTPPGSEWFYFGEKL